ncbi:MAG: hypothetical protein AAGE96_18590 [Cyanobacteria bacterium P01_G01_bin.19]
MFDLSNNRPEIAQQKWRSQLDCFVNDYELQLAALAWKLRQEWQESKDILGIDLKPKPHFVACSYQDLEVLNKNTKGQLQEILGIVDGHDSDAEVVIVAIGEGQIKLINFKPESALSECFNAVDTSVDRLIANLEQALEKYIAPLEK